MKARGRRRAALLAVALFGAAPAAAQTSDSARLVRAAPGAQRNFETLRRSHLPWTGGGGGSGGCDARIGRFCYWHGAVPEHPPPEAEATARARIRLLATLDSAGRMAPGDGWIAGQRVRYWIEAGAPDSALAALTPCGATDWWCDALRGLALHEAARYHEAESAFDGALAEMPEAERCRWTDLSDLLDGPLAHRYARAGCRDRQAINERLWWLAQPFYAMDANDRRTEHFARLTMARIAEHSAWAETASWDDDLRELFVRYGWPRWFERQRSDVLTDGSYAIMGHDPQPSFAFFPAARLLDSLYDARPGDWDLDAPHAQSRYAPAYVTALEPVRTLISRFRRGDSLVVVAAFDATGDSVLGHRPLHAALAVAPDTRQRFVARVSVRLPTGGVAVTAPMTDALASVELFADSDAAAGRVRRGIHPLSTPAAGGISLSDILLFRPRGPLPADLESAVPLAVVGASAPDGQALGLYWEFYGALNSGAMLDVSLTIERTGVGWWQRARHLLHLGRPDAPIALRWQDVARPETTATGRAVAVDLSRLDGGMYRIRLQIQTQGQSAVAMERRLEVRR